MNDEYVLYQKMIIQYMNYLPYVNDHSGLLVYLCNKYKCESAIPLFSEDSYKVFLAFEEIIASKSVVDIGNVLGVREQIFQIVWNRLEQYCNLIPDTHGVLRAIRKSLGSSYPRYLYSIADMVWSYSNVDSVDFNYYTKRAILSLILAKVMKKFRNDYSFKYSETKDFLRDQLESVVFIGILKKRLKSFLK
ncbi:MAG: hypothetical protein P857_1029 [Candidatus Xenolissoclinum pacificiensis L6]|uniref:COQ9 C-terminal domain-containing protein n=1 Tax=Candidatus Xenolissoclinum pacificiensis L6 TaxID=1401685 RepID=W2V0B6_9RICK|nr:MAG: hypothetical protein P857_1029 [Candidatus Xenolissoclinum pacificiensis L6]